MLPSFKTPISVLVIIHTLSDSVLLLERAAHPGYWQSVTGSQEAEETLPQTAVREVAEETGIIVPAAQLVEWQQMNTYEIFHEWRHRYAPGVTHNTEHVFSLVVPENMPIQLSPCEHRAYRWVPLALAADLVFSPSNREAILALPRRRALQLRAASF